MGPYAEVECGIEGGVYHIETMDRAVFDCVSDLCWPDYKPYDEDNGSDGYDQDQGSDGNASKNSRSRCPDPWISHGCV